MHQQQADLKLLGFGKVVKVKARLNSTLLDVVRSVNNEWLKRTPIPILKNCFNSQQLDMYMTVETVLVNEEGSRIIQIKGSDERKIGSLTNPEFDQSQDEIMKSVLYAVLNKEQTQLKKYCEKRKISEQTFVLATRIIKNLGNIKTQTVSLQGKQIEKLTIELKKAQENIGKYKTTLNEKSAEINKLKQTIKNLEANPNHNQNHNTQLSKKIKELEDRNSTLLRQNGQLKKLKNIVCPILFKSKIFQSQHLKDKLNECSSNLENFLNSFKPNNKIKAIRSKLFTDTQNAEPFVQKLKVNKKFVWLFQGQGKLFGIYSNNSYATKMIKSYDGFFFTLQPNIKMFKLRQKKFIWKHSASQINILNETLTMSDPKNSMFIMKKKDKLSNNIEISQAEESSILGDHSDIVIEMFECLTIQFQDEEEQEIQRASQKFG